MKFFKEILKFFFNFKTSLNTLKQPQTNNFSSKILHYSIILHHHSYSHNINIPINN